MKIGMIVAAVLLIGFGIYRISKNHGTEGFLEILGGILELFFEVLGVFL